MASPLKDIAIKLALEKKWDQAIETNLQILEENPHDIDTLNRIGFAYIQNSQNTKAQEVYKKVLSLDPSNPIALKNLKKAESENNGSTSQQKTYETNINDLYIEEAGKTKTIDLTNIADKKTLATLQTGELVNLIVKRSKIYVQSFDNKYIGMLPDSIGMRLTSFIQGGNEYRANVKSVSDKSVTVFVKEVKRAPKFKNQPSFILTQFAQARRT